MTDAVKEAYTDRNLAVQVLARLAQELGFPAGLRIDPDEPDWPVLVVDLSHGTFKEGQLTWHLAKDDMVGQWHGYPGEWDGHSTTEKRRRMIEYLEDRRD